jgi:integrase/recombinase XerD
VLRLPSVRNSLAERILPEADLHRLLSLEPEERNRVLLILIYASGVRRGEVAGLRWRDLQAAGESGQITVFGKGGKTRSIQLPDSVWKQLRKLRGKSSADDVVFPSRKKGKPLTESAIWRIVKQAAVRAGLELPVSPHWLRHAHASHALDRGAPIHLVQATLGHASITTTGRYLHAPTQGKLQQVPAAVMDDLFLDHKGPMVSIPAYRETVDFFAFDTTRR